MGSDRGGSYNLGVAMFTDADVWQLAAKWQKEGRLVNSVGVRYLLSSGKHQRMRRCRSLRRALEHFSARAGGSKAAAAPV